MKCYLCQKETNELVDSHIIAKSIHALSTRGKDPTTSKILSNNPREYPKRSPTGVYDQFLCGNCESIFQDWENYALDFFKKVDELPAADNTHIKLSNYNYQKLKLFCISVLWKASASTNIMYQQVDVEASHYNVLRQLLLNKDPGEWQDYSVFMERFNSDKTYASVIRSPQKSKMDDVIFYTFYMAGFKIHIKCDNRKIPSEIAEFFLQKNQPLIIPLIDFQNSREHEEFIKLIYQPNNLKAFS